PGDLIAADILLVAGDDMLGPPGTPAVMKIRLGDPARRDCHFFAMADIGHLALAQRFLHRRFDFGPRPCKETLSVTETFAFRVRTTVNDVHSGPRRGARGPLSRLVYAHVPLHEPANLPLGVAARHHALEEISVLFLRLGVLLGAKADHRQQVLDLREHAPLND